MVISDSFEFIKEWSDESKVQKISKKDIPAEFNSIFEFGNDLYRCESDIDVWDYIVYTQITQDSHFDLLYELSSTSDFSKNLIAFSGEGKNFHGSKGRRWVAEYGNIHLAALISDADATEQDDVYYNIILLKSIIDTITKFSPMANPKIKWINDIFLNDEKIAGVISRSIWNIDKRNIVFGIGLNVLSNPKVEDSLLRYTTTSLDQHINIKNHHVVETTLAKNLSKFLIAGCNYNEMVNFYNAYLHLKGEETELISDTTPIQILNKGLLLGVNNNLELVFENTPVKFRKGRLRKV